MKGPEKKYPMALYEEIGMYQMGEAWSKKYVVGMVLQLEMSLIFELKVAVNNLDMTVRNRVACFHDLYDCKRKKQR